MSAKAAGYVPVRGAAIYAAAGRLRPEERNDYELASRITERARQHTGGQQKQARSEAVEDRRAQRKC